MQQISIQTRRHTQFLDITREVREAMTGSGMRDGLLTVYCPHTTAAITINEHADPDVAHDLERRLEGLVPWTDEADRHTEGNTAAHLKASLIGSSATVIVRGGQLRLGTWQGIFFCEFDGPRTREVWLAFAPSA